MTRTGVSTSLERYSPRASFQHVFLNLKRVQFRSSPFCLPNSQIQVRRTLSKELHASC